MASLRTRLLVSVLLLAAAGLIALAAVTYAEQRSFLEGRVDQQADGAGHAQDPRQRAGGAPVHRRVLWLLGFALPRLCDARPRGQRSDRRRLAAARHRPDAAPPAAGRGARDRRRARGARPQRVLR